MKTSQKPAQFPRPAGKSDLPAVLVRNQDEPATLDEILKSERERAHYVVRGGFTKFKLGHRFDLSGA